MNKILVGAVAVFAALVACSSNSTSDDAAADCSHICGRYKSCFNENYDTSACETKCHDQSVSDKDYKAKSNTCDACITDRDCTAATFHCATECGGIVP